MKRYLTASDDYSKILELGESISKCRSNTAGTRNRFGQEPAEIVKISTEAYSRSKYIMVAKSGRQRTKVSKGQF